MEKLQVFGAGFDVNHSSCSDLKPKTFEWTTEESPIKVFIDSAIVSGMNYEKKSGEKKIAWVCESRAIFHSWFVPVDVWETYIENIASRYDLLFVSDRQWLGKAANIKYCPAGSNLAWAKDKQLHAKTKLVSMVASKKKISFGHNIRHTVAEKFQNNVDLYGGVLNSKRIGSNIWDKSEALNDYMFSIVMENDSYSTYYTEKITDCFATGVIPIYWGAPDIGDLFNLEGIIKLTPDFDIKLLTPDLYQSKMSAVIDNFNRVKALESADDQLYKLINEN